MRLAAGSWRELTAAAAGQRTVALAVGPDKSRRTIAQEMALRRIKQSFEGGVVGRFFVDKTAFTITQRWTPIVKVCCHPDGTTELLWNTQGLEKLGLREAVMEQLASEALRKAAITWSGS